MNQFLSISAAEEDVVPNFVRLAAALGVGDVSSDVEELSDFLAFYGASAYIEDELRALPPSPTASLDEDFMDDDSRYARLPDTPVSVSSEEDVGPSSARVDAGECYATKALRLFAKTSTGATVRDAERSSAPECPLCYTRRACHVSLGCGHVACLSCLEKATEVSKGPVTQCFVCRSEPGIVTRMYS